MIKSRQLLGRMININDFIFLPEGKEYQNESVKSNLCSIMLTKNLTTQRNCTGVGQSRGGWRWTKICPANVKQIRIPLGYINFRV